MQQIMMNLEQVVLEVDYHMEHLQLLLEKHYPSKLVLVDKTVELGELGELHLLVEMVRHYFLQLVVLEVLLQIVGHL